ncbi:MAG: aspartate ammonia-lyase [Bacteriovorax sp.]|nr:aspartate ammonia-lyase [Bacteriovorax sp.]
MRIEKDSIGQLEIADDAYYGIQSYRASQNFQISGTQVHPLMIKSYLLLKKAAAIANEKAKVLEPKKAGAIVAAIDQLINLDNHNDSSKYFIVDAYQAGAGTSQNMNANEVIANKANEILGKKLGSYSEINPNDHVNMSQSTNDSYPTVMRLATLALSNELLIELKLFSSSLEIKAREFDHILKAGRTHLQDAVPIRLGQEFGAYKYTVDQLIKLIIEAQGSLRVLGIGGSAVGTGINVPKSYRDTIILELRNIFQDSHLTISPNLIASMQSQLPMMIYSNALRATALELTRIMNDLRLLSSGPSTGLAEITLPSSQPGSSIMPGKINPSLLEMGNQVFFKVIGNDSAMAFAVSAGQLELNVMMPLMAQLSLESTHIMKNALHSIRERCIDGIKANEKQCEKYVGQTSQIATALSPVIGYAKASELAKQALSENKSIIELIKEKKILTDEQFNKLLNLREMTELK